MNYKVIKTFADLQDNKHVYVIGDEYPRKGYSPTTERIAELSSGMNLLHKPLIQLVDEPMVEKEPESVPELAEVVEEKEEPETVAEAEIVEEPKRKRGRKSND